MTQPTRHGFSLIELSIVLIILGVVIGGILPFVSRSQQSSKEGVTQARIDHIMIALERYVAAFGALPCPATATNAVNATGIGTASASATAGSHCANSYTSASYTISSVTHLIASGGSVPTAELGLHPRYLLDGWGNRFTYVVDPDLTRCTDYPNEPASIKVINGSLDSMVGDNSITQWATGGGQPGDNFDPDTQGVAVVVISHGAEGGGYATANGVVIDTTSGGNLEGENALQTGSSFSGHFWFSPPNPGITSEANHFDDVLRYRTKAQLPAPPAVCP